MSARRIAIWLSASLLIATTTATAEDPVNIPDPALKAAIEAALGIPDPIPSDMLGLTSLGTSNRKVADLTGLEYARNLRRLDLSQNDINDLSPLAELVNLTWLNLSNNYLTDIRPLAGLVNLMQLWLHNAYGGDYDWNAQPEQDPRYRASGWLDPIAATRSGKKPGGGSVCSGRYEAVPAQHVP